MVIDDVMVAVLVLWVGNSRQYVRDNSAAVGGNIISMPAIEVFTLPRHNSATNVENLSACYLHKRH